jgi:NAD(P)-dependent dehydrogenase (short-subunit alcohol dehydrogenase family)
LNGIVIVTGAFGALGAAVAKRLAASGYRVAAVDAAPDGPAPPGSLTLGGVDAADPDAMAEAFARIAAAGETIVGLVNIAGGFAWEPLADGAIETWDRMYRVNLRTAANACRLAVPLLGPGAVIVNVGALGAVNPAAGMGAYAAAKAGVACLTESLAAELRPKRIRVNAILPSIIDTEANRRDMPDADVSTWVKPDELAAVIAFLLSDSARPVNGALLPVTG